MLALFELNPKYFEQTSWAIWQLRSRTVLPAWSLLAISFWQSMSLQFISFLCVPIANKLKQQLLINRCPVTAICWIQSRQVTVIFFIRAILIIHTPRTLIQSLFAIKISHANGISLIEANRKEKTFPFLWNKYLLAQFHTWYSENKVIISRECDVNVYIKEESSLHVSVGNGYKSSVTPLNSSSTCLL